MNESVDRSRRSFVHGLLGATLVAALHAGPATAQAQPSRGRMDPDDRERLRRDLRERGAGGSQGREYRGEPGGERGAPIRRYDSPPPRRLSDDERQQLRRQLREAERRR